MLKVLLTTSYLLIGGALLLSSCGDDNPTGPESLTIEAITERSDNNVFTGAVNDTVITNLNISAPLGFLELVITKLGEDNSEEELERKVRASVEQTNVEEVFHYIIQAADANSEFNLRFRAYDVSDAQDDATITVIVN